MSYPFELSVLIPTIPGREAELAQVKSAYSYQLGGQCEILTTTLYSWGEGCNRLVPLAKGRYLLFATDDTVPHEGWFEAGRAIVDEGLTPASRYLHPPAIVDGVSRPPSTGEPLHERDLLPHGAAVEWTRSWLITPERYAEVGPMIDTTWWADIDYSERMEAAGYPIVACDGFSWTHLPTERRWLTMEEEERQRRVYEERRRPDLQRVVPWTS
jgi:GT2 family glycosyltransferase